MINFILAATILMSSPVEAIFAHANGTTHKFYSGKPRHVHQICPHIARVSLLNDEDGLALDVRMHNHGVRPVEVDENLLDYVDGCGCSSIFGIDVYGKHYEVERISLKRCSHGLFELHPQPSIILLRPGMGISRVARLLFPPRSSLLPDILHVFICAPIADDCFLSALMVEQVYVIRLQPYLPFTLAFGFGTPRILRHDTEWTPGEGHKFLWFALRGSFGIWDTRSSLILRGVFNERLD